MAVECLAADRAGMQRAARLVAEAPADRAPLVLVLDAGGAAVQALLHIVELAARDVDVVCLAAKPADGLMRAAGPPVALLAHAQWGARVVGRASHLTAVGQPILRTPGTPMRLQMLALEVRIRAARPPQLDPPRRPAALGRRRLASFTTTCRRW